jgi:hypothetical protein
MSQFGEVRVDFITYTTGVAPNEGTVTTSVSGLINSPTFSGVTVINTGVFSSGSAASPSITFTGDVDTGLFSAAANSVSFTLSGTERWRISGDGSVYTYSSGAVQVPTGTTSARPTNALTGMLRYNTTSGQFEGFSASGWSQIAGGGASDQPAGSGGNAVFFLNDQVVTASYTFPSGKNGMSAGTITIQTGVTVVLGSGQNWVIV